MTLGERILKYRKKAGISQEELADRLNVTRQSISLWETDQTVPSLDNLITIAELFGISLDELCGRNTDKNDDRETVENTPKEEQQSLACAQTSITPQLLKNMQNFSKRKLLTIYIVGLVLGTIMLAAIACSKDKTALNMLPFPIIIIIIFATCLIRMSVYWQSQYKKSLQKYPNYVYHYLFYNDRMAVKGKSDTTETAFDVKYADIQKTTQDNNFIYVLYDNLILPIEKEKISEHADVVFGLLKLKEVTPDTECCKNRVSVKVALIIMFVLSLLSVFIALFAVMISVQT